MFVSLLSNLPAFLVKVHFFQLYLTRAVGVKMEKLLRKEFWPTQALKHNMHIQKELSLSNVEVNILAHNNRFYGGFFIPVLYWIC